jgi:hypothetical protein
MVGGLANRLATSAKAKPSCCVRALTSFDAVNCLTRKSIDFAADLATGCCSLPMRRTRCRRSEASEATWPSCCEQVGRLIAIGPLPAHA